jgi:hypothetical protein
VSLIPAKFTAADNDTGDHIFPEIYTDLCATGGEYVTCVNDASGELANIVNDDAGGNFAAGVIERSMKKPSVKNLEPLSL